MINTSLGYHTFSFFQREKEDEFNLIVNDFIRYVNKDNDMKRFPVKDKKGKGIGWEYFYEKNKGIRWLLLSYNCKNGITVQGVMVVINPKALIEGNYIVAAQEGDLEEIAKIYNNEAAKISSELLRFGSCSINRADHCINIDLDELGIPCLPEQMMALIKQGNIPRNYKERVGEYDQKQHRKIPDKHSFYLESKSSVINYYWKYPQQNENHPNYMFREASRNVIRFEVQCKYLKLYSISKNIKYESKLFKMEGNPSLQEIWERIQKEVCPPSVPVDIVLSNKISEKIIQKYFYKILRKGDYFTLSDAKNIVKSYDFRREKEERIIYALEQVNECHGIANAKAKLHGLDLDEFKRSLKDLDNMLINPVTIPRRWGIKHIPNLLRAYYEAAYEEELIPRQEFIARKHIAEFLSR